MKHLILATPVLTFLLSNFLLQHSTMRCLTDVMDFFVSSAGPTAKPMKNNDLASIGLSGFSKKKQTGLYYSL